MKTVTARPADRTLHANESAKAGLCRVADGSIREALERISQPSGDPAGDVHFIRTTTKRLRAILRLFRPVISPDYLTVRMPGSRGSHGALHPRAKVWSRDRRWTSYYSAPQNLGGTRWPRCRNIWSN